MNSSDAPPARSGVSRLGVASWVLYEWARNPFVLLVTLYIFAPYFANELVGDPEKGQVLWAEIVGYGGIAVAVLAPFFGAIADAGGRRKPWVLFFTLVIVVSELLLWLPQPGGIGLSLFMTGVAVVAANAAYDFSQVFHGAMLTSLGPPNRIGRLSGLGYALGNVAGVLLLIFALAFIYLPDEPLFGLDKNAHEHDRIIGPMCALWLVVFCLPFFLFTPDRPSARLPWGKAIVRGLASVITTIKSLRHYRNVALYLAARALYNDGTVALLSFGGVYASGVFGWDTSERAAFGILLSICAAIGAYAGGWLADRITARATILLSVAGTAVAAAASLGFAPDRIFFVFGVTPDVAVWASPVFPTLPELIYVGVVMVIAVFIVGTWANSRTMLARIAPEARMAEFFGLYALSGTATAFLAPWAVKWVTEYTDSQQWGMAAILGFLGAGFLLMLFVRESRVAAARENSP
jgi:UMF1 family MFS transporter